MKCKISKKQIRSRFVFFYVLVKYVVYNLYLLNGRMQKKERKMTKGEILLFIESCINFRLFVNHFFCYPKIDI